MATRGAASRGVLVLVIVLATLVLGGACGEQPAAIHGTIPRIYEPIPSGDVHLDVVPAADPSAEPVADFTSSSGWYKMEVPPGTYVVRIHSFNGTVEAVSRQVEVAAGDNAEAVFDTPQ